MDDTTQWARGIEGIYSTTTTVTSNNNVTPITTKPQSTAQEQQQLLTERSRAAKPEKEQALKCPRCNSTNTKFCYYNNYSLTQPRYLCKNCRRYWTHGGSLRNVPVGGGTRKNKKPTSSTKISTDVKIINNMQPPPPPLLSLPMSSSSITKPYHGHGHDLNLAFSDRLSCGFGPLIHMFPLDGNGNGMQENELFPFVVKPSNESGQQIKGQVGDPQVRWSGANLGGNGGLWY